MKKYIVAVVGATGAVGEELFKVIKEYDIPVEKIVPLASAKSAGKTIEFNGEQIEVLELTCDVFKEQNIEIAFFSAIAFVMLPDVWLSSLIISTDVPFLFFCLRAHQLNLNKN